MITANLKAQLLTRTQPKLRAKSDPNTVRVVLHIIVFGKKTFSSLVDKKFL